MAGEAGGYAPPASFAALFAPDLIRTTLVARSPVGVCLRSCVRRTAIDPISDRHRAAGICGKRSSRPQRSSANRGKTQKLPKDAPEVKELRKQRLEKLDELKRLGKSRVGTTQRWQEIGGLLGRVILAILLIFVASRRTLLRIFQVPGMIVLPLTYFYFFSDRPGEFMILYFFAGLFTIAQFSYFGEYLPKVFPVHLRGTGGSFATNVGGRMIGTMAAPFVTEFLAPLLAGSAKVNATHYAMGAGIVGTGVFVVGFHVLSFILARTAEET